MREIFELFSLTTYGDAPIGLKNIRETNKLNQPTLAEQKRFNFSPLFATTPQFAFQYINEEDYENEEEYSLSWFSQPGHKSF